MPYEASEAGLWSAQEKLCEPYESCVLLRCIAFKSMPLSHCLDTCIQHALPVVRVSK
jgi:hypothetical protein